MNKCEHCGSVTKNKRFCSQSCSGKHVVGRRPDKGVNTCKSCGNEFEWVGSRQKIKQFCNSSCSASYNNKIHVKRKRSDVSNPCRGCGVPLYVNEHSRRRAYCSNDCRVDSYNATRMDRFRDDEITESDLKSKLIRGVVLSEQDGVCACCGCLPEHNELPLVFVMDHIDGNSYNNKRDNLRLVCPNCDSQLPTFKSRNRGNGRHFRRERYRSGQSY